MTNIQKRIERFTAKAKKALMEYDLYSAHVKKLSQEEKERKRLMSQIELLRIKHKLSKRDFAEGVLKISKQNYQHFLNGYYNLLKTKQLFDKVK